MKRLIDEGGKVSRRQDHPAKKLPGLVNKPSRGRLALDSRVQAVSADIRHRPDFKIETDVAAHQDPAGGCGRNKSFPLRSEQTPGDPADRFDPRIKEKCGGSC